MPAAFPDARLLRAGISAARVDALRAAYNAMGTWEQGRLRALVASRPDEVLRRTYDPAGAPPAAGVTTAQVVADPALLTAVQTAILAAHDTDAERETFVPSRLADPALRAAFGRRSIELAAARPALDTTVVTAAAPSMNVSLGNQVGGGITSPVTYFPDNPIFTYTHGVPALYTGSTSAALAGDFFYGYGGLTGPAGAWVPFRVSVLTDAPIAEFKYLGTSAPRMRFWVDGQLLTWTAATGFVTGGSGTPYSPANSILVPSGASYVADGKTHYVRLAFGTSQIRRITMESDFAYFGGLIVGAADAVAKIRPANEPRVVVLGDSFTAGSGGDAPGTSWAQVVGRYLGWQVRASGAAGTGYLQTNGTGPKLRDRLAADLYPYPADAAVIAMGINDGSFTPSQVQTEAVAVYAAIAANKPNLPVYVLTPWVSHGPPNSTQQALRDAVIAAAQAAPNVKGVVDASGYVLGTGNVSATTGNGPADRFISSDSTHPTQVGHEWIGRRAAEDLYALVAA